MVQPGDRIGVARERSGKGLPGVGWRRRGVQVSRAMRRQQPDNAFLQFGCGEILGDGLITLFTDGVLAGLKLCYFSIIV